MPQTERAIRPISAMVSATLSWFNSLFKSNRRWWFWNTGTREVLPDMTQTRAIDDGFNSNAAVYAIVNDDADKFASIPRYVYDAKSMADKQQRRMPTHLKAVAGAKVVQNDLSKLLSRPNPYEGQAAWLKKVRAYYKVSGEAFIWLNRGDVGDKNDMQQDLMPVLEMYVLPTDMTKVVPDPENLWGVAGYILEVGGVQMPIRKNDVIHWKSINLKWDASTKEHLRGMSPLKPGAATLQQNNDATLGATRMYQNDGSKGVIYGEDNRPNAISPTQESTIRSVVDRKINNNDIKGAVASIFGLGKLGYIDLGGTSVDLQLLEGKKMTWQELCAVLGVPFEFYNTETTFANKEWAQKNWVTNKIIPACKEFDDELNRQLLKAFKLEGQAVIASDFSELPELQENMKELAEWLERAYWILPNEKREMMGYEKVTDPLFDEPWMPSTLTPLSQMNEPDPLDDLGLSDYGVGAPSKNGQQTQAA